MEGVSRKTENIIVAAVVLVFLVGSIMGSLWIIKSDLPTWIKYLLLSR